MPITEREHLLKALGNMRSEHRTLGDAIAGLEAYLGVGRTAKPTPGGSGNSNGAVTSRKPAPRAKAPARRQQNTSAAPAKAGGAQVSLRGHVLTTLSSGGNRGWSTAELTKALVKKGSLTGGDTRQQQERVGKALTDLRRRGAVVSERDGQFAPAVWRLAR
jgi:hypothetical protein